MFSRSAIKLPDMRRWSLTTRMTLFFAIAIVVIVSGVSAMMYSELVHQLHEKEEAELRDDLQIQRDVLEGLAHKRPPNQWQNEWSEYQEGYQKFAWQLLAPDRTLRVGSSNAAAFAAALAHAGAESDVVRWTERARAPHRHFLLLDMPVDTLGPEARELRGVALGPAGTVLRGALDVSQDQHVLEAYRARLAGVIGLAIVLSAAAGWLLARRGLAPVRAIGSEIGRINARKLHARISNEAWPSELRVLASTFDDMLARLERSFEQLTRFSSDLAHEFRSPINSLVAAASVTLARARDPAEYQATLEVVVEEGERLSRMVSSMLFLARADNAQQHLRPERLQLQQEFRKLADFYDIMADEQGVTLVTEGVGELTADPLLLRRALSNLLTNALCHTPRGGTIRLAARHESGAVAITISDDGAGIAAEHLPFLFDRFYRVDEARSAADSTGLGLAVVRSIAELHGGQVSVVSEPGTGSAFTLRFPIQPALIHENID
jgi:two-component system heavy metal sensor histidine kinase CusS